MPCYWKGADTSVLDTICLYENADMVFCGRIPLNAHQSLFYSLHILAASFNALGIPGLVDVVTGYEAPRWVWWPLLARRYVPDVFRADTLPPTVMADHPGTDHFSEDHCHPPHPSSNNPTTI